jgi:hypothetical protein
LVATVERLTGRNLEQGTRKAARAPCVKTGIVSPESARIRRIRQNPEEEPEQVEIMLGGIWFGMAAPVNIHVNSRVKRDKWRNIELQSTEESEKYQSGGLWGKRGRR